MGMMICGTVARLRRALGPEAPEADHHHGRLASPRSYAACGDHLRRTASQIGAAQLVYGVTAGYAMLGNTKLR